MFIILRYDSDMRIWDWLISVFITLVCMLLLAKLIGASSGASARPDHREQLASRLSAQAELAEYAAYHAASVPARKFGIRMSDVIACEAAGQHIRLPAPMNEWDARWVETMESAQGGEFDALYLTSIQTQLKSIEHE